MEFQYIKLANDLEAKVSGGEYRAGEKLPSLRRMREQRGLSMSTVYQAYVELENRGLVEAREKSGFYVRPLLGNLLHKPTTGDYSLKPVKVAVNALAGVLQDHFDKPEMLLLGAAIPDAKILPVKQLSRIAREVSAVYLHREGGTGYGAPSGLPALQRQIVRRAGDSYDVYSGEEVIITSGCMHAINLCLRAVANPGDIILVESPTFVCYLQLIEDLNMRVVEIPADPDQGLDFDMLTRAVEEQNVRAALLNSNFPNPLGHDVATEKKRAVVRYMNDKGVPIIEDDIYGELYFGDTRPTTLKQYDEKGLVLFCSSFSKSLLPDLRIGWTVPGRFKEKVKRLKFNSVISSPKLNQMILAEFLESGAYERHLRRMRNTLKNQVGNMCRAVARHFPEDTRMSSPKGGLALWVQLNHKVDSLQLAVRAAEQGISILPGAVCSGSGQYNHCIRLNCGVHWDQPVEEGIATLGGLIKEVLE